MTNIKDNQRWKLWMITEVPKEENRPYTKSYIIQENTSKIKIGKAIY